MRKKELFEKFNELVDSLNSLQHQLFDLQRENNELKTEISKLRSNQADKSDIDLTQTSNNEEQENKAKGFSVAEFNEDEFEADKLLPEHPKTTSTEVDYEPIVLKDEDMEYGSVAIGRIVQESIKYANVISSSDSDNKKELLNLIMGKGEIAKAEIFSVTESDNSSDIKHSLIDAQVSEAVDYFKSIVGQI